MFKSIEWYEDINAQLYEVMLFDLQHCRTTLIRLKRMGLEFLSTTQTAKLSMIKSIGWGCLFESKRGCLSLSQWCKILNVQLNGKTSLFSNWWSEDVYLQHISMRMYMFNSIERTCLCSSQCVSAHFNRIRVAVSRLMG